MAENKRPMGLKELLELNEKQLVEEGALLERKPSFAWEGPMSIDIPIFKGTQVVGTEQRTVQIKYAVESVYTAATTARDRILARGILSIMEELEKRKC